ncbi:MAG: hypothetical protein KJ957_00480 [Candidatus Omnitrophica bacterium]|nr:hypothetical protein [Candidatus Omnitrophota bacterium]MBU1852503.1 hypothetical protein [Candidatus Omnitrophota bacterium]
MSNTFKIVLILLVVASIASAVLAVFGFLEKEKEYMKRVLIEEKLTAVLKDKKRLEKELSLNKEAMDGKEAEIKEVALKIEQLSLLLEEEKERSKSQTLDLTDKEKKIEALTLDLEREKREKLSLSKKLDDIKSAYEKAETDVLKLKQEKMQLEKDVTELEEKSVELDKIVVPSSMDAFSAPPMESQEDVLKGKVLVVNREYSFIVTDLGQGDGVKKDMVFEVRDGTNFLGKAKIDKIYDTMSSASVLPGTNINNIKKGNLIIESR